MPELEIQEIAAAVGGEVRQAGGPARFGQFGFDSRQLPPGGLFFALAGQRDGHEFLADLVGRPGCGAVVRADRLAGVPAGLPLVVVGDTREAYIRLAGYVRRQLDEVRYLAVTGSAGKTSTKEFTWQILSRHLKAYRSPGNWNNWQGIPFALLGLPADTEAAVFELAMSDPGIGEIDHLARLVRPDVAVVLNALPVHLEYLHTVENVIRAKLEILNHLEADGTALVNGDNPLLRRAVRRLPGRVITFGRHPDHNDVILKDVRPDPAGSRFALELWGRERVFTTSLRGDTHLDNLLPAILMAWLSGLQFNRIQDALLDLEPVAGRGVSRVCRGATVIDETYNANPEAVKAVLRWVARTAPGERVAVLGDMLELGDGETMYHQEVGRTVAELGFDRLLAVGRRAGWIADGAVAAGMSTTRVERLADAEAAGWRLRELLQPGLTVVCKASRGIGLDRALRVLDQP